MLRYIALVSLLYLRLSYNVHHFGPESWGEYRLWSYCSNCFIFLCGKCYLPFIMWILDGLIRTGIMLTSYSLLIELLSMRCHAICWYGYMILIWWYIRHRARMPVLPSIRLLGSIVPWSTANADQQRLLALHNRLLYVLQTFSIKADIVEYFVGPQMTVFKLALAIRSSYARIMSLQYDIARILDVATLHIFNTEPLIMTVPSLYQARIGLNQLTTANMQHIAMPLVFCSLAGQAIVKDLPQRLIITGGQEVDRFNAIHSILCTLLMQHAPTACQILLLDRVRAALSMYDSLPHMHALNNSAKDVQQLLVITADIATYNDYLNSDRPGLSVILCTDAACADIDTADNSAKMILSRSTTAMMSDVLWVSQQHQSEHYHIPSIDLESVTRIVSFWKRARQG